MAFGPGVFVSRDADARGMKYSYRLSVSFRTPVDANFVRETCIMTLIDREECKEKEHNQEKCKIM